MNYFRRSMFLYIRIASNSNIVRKLTYLTISTDEQIFYPFAYLLLSLTTVIYALDRGEPVEARRSSSIDASVPELAQPIADSISPPIAAKQSKPCQPPPQQRPQPKTKSQPSPNPNVQPDRSSQKSPAVIGQMRRPGVDR
jgi:hypothetical protein